MKPICMICTAFLAAGCAGAVSDNTRWVDDSEYRRETGRIEAMEEFQLLKRSCRNAGGIVQVPRASSGRFPLTAFEMRSATCSHRIGSAQVI